MKRAKFLGAALLFVVLLLNPERAASSAQQAMRVWYSSVAPALFPFLVLMPMLTSEEACAAYEKLFARWMRPMFRLPGAAAPAVIVGIIAGSPGGAIALQCISSNSRLTREQARRVALAAGGVSPAYLIMGVGQGIHGSVELGIQLAAAQALIQVLLLILLPEEGIEGENGFYLESKSWEKRNPITSAVESILGVCGYMVFYSVIAGVLAGIAGNGMGTVLLLVMDLPSGLEALARSPLPEKMLLQGAAVGFSGLCIIFQNMNVLQALKIKWRDYIGMRITSAALLALAAMAMEGKWMGKVGDLFGSMRMNYAFSLFVAGISILPGLYFLSKKLFLNKTKNGEI